MAEKKKIQLTGQQLMQMHQRERQKLDNINQRLETYNKFRQDMRAAKDALKEISDSKKGEKLLVNLGAGVYVEAKIDETEKAITSINSNAFKEKTNKEIIASLEEKIKNIDETIKNTAKEQQETISKMTQYERIIQAGRAQARKQQKA